MKAEEVEILKKNAKPVYGLRAELQRDWNALIDHTISVSGTFLITDPAYFLKDKDYDLILGRRNHLETLGIRPSYFRPNLYGDAAFGLYSETGQLKGTFTSDAGLTGVFNYEDVLRYNPKYADKMSSYTGLAYILKDFEGDVSFLVVPSGIDVRGFEYSLKLEILGRNLKDNSSVHLVSKMASW